MGTYGGDEPNPWAPEAPPPPSWGAPSPGGSPWGTPPPPPQTPWGQPPTPYAAIPGWGAPPPKSGMPAWAKWLIIAAVVFVGLGIFGAIAGDPKPSSRSSVSTAPTLRVPTPRSSGPLAAPATFGGVQRSTSALGKGMERDVIREMGLPGAVAAVYGDNAKYLLIATHGSVLSNDTMFAAYAEGMETNDGFDVGSPREIGGVVCATVTSPRGRGAMCGWSNRHSSGYAYGPISPDLDALARATVAARAFIDG